MASQDDVSDVLIEIGTEELPPHCLQNLTAAFAKALSKELTAHGVAHQNIKEFASPRRLALIIHDVADRQNEQVIERRGPPLSKAYDENKKPTLLALGFAKSCGVDLTQLSVEATNKGDCLFFRRREPGQAIAALLPEFISSALNALPITKPMRWGSGSAEFARPIRWIVILQGDAVIESNIFGIKTGATTYGHRFHHPQGIILKNAGEYVDKLMTAGRVMVDFNKRREMILEQMAQLTKTIGKTMIDETLLDEVTGMVEWPVALLGSFSPEFLALPPEVLISVMKVHQKCFHIEDAQGQLLRHFIMVSNIESKNTGRVIADNECVMQARLKDADFFYNTDKKHKLIDQVKKLEQVLFQNKLGSMLDKAKRIEKLMDFLARQMNIDLLLAKRSGLLAKADLVTDMVGEFPELNGIMGYYYAKQDGEPAPVAMAIKEHYFPRYAGDQLPKTDLGCLLSIADKLDTVVSLFTIGQAPTGDKDPFALRRAALGLLRIIIEKNYLFDLRELIDTEKADINKQILDFILERLRAWYLEQGVRTDVFAAVYATYPTQPFDFHQRIQAVNAFVESPAAKSLAAANKRVSHILKKHLTPLGGERKSFSQDLLIEKAEQTLATAVHKKMLEVAPLYQRGDYSAVLNALISLQEPIDDFFNEVMVMVDNDQVRENRLALLNQLYVLFSQVADISLLQE